MNSNENLHCNLDHELHNEKWKNLMRIFFDINYIKLLYDQDDKGQENFYDCLFDLFKNDEDFREISHPIEEESYENPFNKFFGYSDMKLSNMNSENPSIFNLNYVNICVIFSFLVRSLNDLKKESNGKIERKKLKMLFDANFSFFTLKEISFLHKINDVTQNGKPMNLYLLIITLEILYDLYGDQIMHVNIGITDYLMDFFYVNSNLEDSSSNIENKRFFSDLYFAYIIVFLFYNKIKSKSMNPNLNSCGLSITIFEHHPDLIENYTFNSHLFGKFFEKGNIERNKLQDYNLIKLIKDISATSNFKELKESETNITTVSRLEISILSDHFSSKCIVNDLISFNSQKVFYQFLKLTILESIYTDEEMNFVDNLLNKIKACTRNFSLILIPSIGDDRSIDAIRKEDVIEMKKNRAIEINLDKLICTKSDRSSLRSLSLQGNNFDIKSNNQISQIQEFHLYTDNIRKQSICFVYQFTHISHLTLTNLSLNNFQELSSNWENFRSLRSVNLSVRNTQSDSKQNERIVSELCTFLFNIYYADVDNLSKIENIKIYIMNQNVKLQEEICRAFLYLIQKVSTLIYFSLIYKCEFEDELELNYSVISIKKFLSQIKYKFPDFIEESNRLNGNIFVSEDQVSYLLVCDSEMEHLEEKKFDIKNENKQSRLFKMDDFISLFLIIQGTNRFKILRRPPILVKLYQLLAKRIKKRVYFIENYLP